jgi:hypothetical protein
MRSQPAGQSKTPGYARERFDYLPADRIEIVTDGEMQDVLARAITLLRDRCGG